MNSIVLDASVIATVYFQEEFSDAAKRLLNATSNLLAPDFVLAELANVTWKRFIRRSISRSEAGDILSDICELPLQLVDCADLVRPALDIALQTNRTVYDCLYISLAMDAGCEMISADRRLVRSLAGSEFGKCVKWIGDR